MSNEKSVELDRELFDRLQVVYKEEKKNDPTLGSIDEFAEKMLRLSLEKFKEETRCLN